MTLPVDRPPAATPAPTGAGREADDQPAPEQRAAEEPAGRRSVREKLGIEERGWLLFAVVVAFIILAFTGMVVLTELAGGSGYIPWYDR